MTDEFKKYIEDEKSKPEWLKDMQVLKLGPDDVIILKSEEILSEKACDYILESIKKVFPGNKCLILDGGMGIGVVSKKDANQRNEKIKSKFISDP